MYSPTNNTSEDDGDVAKAIDQVDHLAQPPETTAVLFRRARGKRTLQKVQKPKPSGPTLYVSARFGGLRAEKFHFRLRLQCFDFDGAFGLLDLLIGTSLCKADVAGDLIVRGVNCSEADSTSTGGSIPVIKLASKTTP